MDSTIEVIHNKVRHMYEDYPYPAYPLWAPLRWQEAYQGSAHFAASIASHASLSHTKKPQVLIAGCGETQPYILRKIEPSQNHLEAVDISQTSIRRAKLRLLWEPKKVKLIQQDLDVYLCSQAESFDHIDCYGVLHHLANPSHTLQLLYNSMKPGGTLRLMVYNDKARGWIFHIKRALQLLGFDPYKPSHIKNTQDFLRSLSYWLPNLQKKLGGMGARTLSNPARLVDTFFHAREARIPLSDWFRAIQRIGFIQCGLFDRYAELDDLPNPLWKMPHVSQLSERAKDKRFENNIELYLQRGSNISLLKTKSRKNKNRFLQHYLKSPPSFWFQFKETQQIPLNLRQRIWWHHISNVYRNNDSTMDRLLGELSMEARQRLARLGAINIKQVGSSNYREQMLEPMWSMEVPKQGEVLPVEDTPVIEIIRAILKKNRRNLDAEKLVVERLNRAQNS